MWILPGQHGMTRQVVPQGLAQPRSQSGRLHRESDCTSNVLGAFIVMGP